MKKMTRILAVALVAAFLMPAFQSCKKGPNDPGISLKSRKARLTGEWTVIKAKVTENSGSGLDTYTYDDGSVVVSLSGGGSYTGSYTWEVSIVKDGTFEITRSETYSGSTYSETRKGNWFFLGENKDADVKNKQWVAFQFTQITTTSGGTTSTANYTGDYFSYFAIDQLKSKEIILIQEYSYTGSGSSYSETWEITLTE